MPKASALRPGSNTSFLFKGPPGFGKTLAAATFAIKGSIYIAYFDKKEPIELYTFFTKKRFGDIAHKILDNIEYDVYGSHNAHEYLNKLIKFSDDCRHIAVITDSVTSLTSAAVNWSLAFRDPKGPQKDKLHKDASKMIPDFDEYKVETSLVTQALDIGQTIPTNVIWIAHPLPSIKIEGTGNSIKVTKTNPIVTYGSKVAGMIPGRFTEIYHFSKQNDWNAGTGKASEKFIVSVRTVGDEFAKSPLLSDDIAEFDITNKLFYNVWRELVNKSMDRSDDVSPEESKELITRPEDAQSDQPSFTPPWMKK